MHQTDLDYSKSTHQFKITRKKFLGQSQRFMYIFPTEIIINKEINKKKPDRRLPMNNIKRVVWKYGDEKERKSAQIKRKFLRGFTLDYQNTSLDYYGDENTLLTLKKALAMHLFQAKVQDEYEAKEMIGEGNYAMVLELRHIHTDLIFAAKCIEKKKLEKMENGLKSIMNEISIMRALFPHPLVVNLHEVYEGDSNIYIVMDIALGGSLYTEMRKRTTLYTRREILLIMKALLQSLAYIHSRNIMHRDLKPENILFQYKDDITSLKLADFGLAAFVDQTPYLYAKCGTPGFVAPEVANLSDKTSRYEAKCDVFSAGVIFHILLLGESLFTGRGHLELLRQNKQCELMPNHSRYDNLDPLSKDLLFKMLEPDPLCRPSAQESLDHAYFVQEGLQQNEELVSNKYVKEELQGSNQDTKEASLIMKPMINMELGGLSFEKQIEQLE